MHVIDGDSHFMEPLDLYVRYIDPAFRDRAMRIENDIASGEATILLDGRPHIVADPEICAGQLTFKDTRIFVKDVLAMLAKGYDWDRISYEFDGHLCHAAIAEAIALASQALQEKTEKRRRAA